MACDGGRGVLDNNPLCSIVGGLTDAVDFATNPLGYLVAECIKGVTGLIEGIFPTLTSLTQPDLSAEWFKSAYSLSWGLSFFLLAFILGMNFFQMARGKVGTDEVVETLSIYLPAWIIGCAFGPMIGLLAMKLVAALTAGIWAFPGFGGGKKMIESGIYLAKLAHASGEPDFPGGSIIAIILLIILIFALLAVLIVMIVMMLTLYFAGALFPLMLTWILKPRTRAKGLKVVYLWVGILVAQVVLFFFLSVSFALFADGMSIMDDKVSSPMKSLFGLIAGIIAIVMAAFSGFWVSSKLGSIGPDGESSGIDTPSTAGAPTSIGPQSPTNSQAAQLSLQTAPGGTDAAGGGEPGGAQRLYDTAGSSPKSGSPAGGGGSALSGTGSSLGGSGGGASAPGSPGTGAGAPAGGSGVAASLGAAGQASAASGGGTASGLAGKAASSAHPAMAAASAGAKATKAGASWASRTASEGARVGTQNSDQGQGD